MAALRQAHAQFSADACLVAVDVRAQRVVGPKLPPEDSFLFLFRSPSLYKVKWEAEICLPNEAGTRDPRCSGEWEFREGRGFDSVRCLPAKIVDSGEALAVAAKSGLPRAPVDGLRLSLRLVPKAGPGLARRPKLQGRPVWLLESRDECHAIDALTLAALHKGRCSKFPWPETK